MGYNDIYLFNPVKNELLGVPLYMRTNPDVFMFDTQNEPMIFEETGTDACVMAEGNSGYLPWGYFNSGAGYFTDAWNQNLRICADGAEKSYEIIKPAAWMNWSDSPYVTVISDDELFFGDDEESVFVFSLNEDHALYELITPAIEFLSTSPDGKYLVVNGVDGVTYIYGVPVESND